MRLSQLRFEFYILTKVVLERDNFRLLPRIEEQGLKAFVRWLWFVFVFEEREHAIAKKESKQ